MARPTYSHPRLFKKASTGKIVQWDIFVKDTCGDQSEGTIITKWGQVGGEIQETQDVIRVGKNVGKKNETSPYEQALLEAKATWEKKLKKGYVKNYAAADDGEVDSVIEGGVWPMLAEKYRDYADKIVWPARAQPKLDGHRCTLEIADGTARLWSKTRKPITALPHITKAALEHFGQHEGEKVFFDGELYNHAYKGRIEELAEFIRPIEPIPGHEVVQFHCYDMADTEFLFGSRDNTVESYFTAVPAGQPLVRVRTVVVEDEDELMVFFEECLEQGYEGAMVRNLAGKYKSHPTSRSKDILKVKKFEDAEFEVTGVEEGRGKLAGHAVFVCQTADGNAFRAKMKGPHSELKKYFENPKPYIGKQLTVKYQGMTKYGVPRFPVAWRWREDV